MLPHPNRLIALPAADVIFWDSEPGVDYLLAHTACSIIACNRFDGYFETAHGDRVNDTNILPAGEYNFVVPGYGSDPYTVTPSLSHYEFRDSDVPPAWRALANVHTPPTRPTRFTIQGSICRLTEYTRSIERAHIIPRHERQWFKSSEMRDYAHSPDITADAVFDGLANRIGLRSDVHTLWDSHEFVFVPKAAEGQGHLLAAHSLVNDAEVVSLYHNIVVHDLDHVPYQYLFARSAIAILSRVPEFIKESQPVKLSIKTASSDYELKQFGWDEAVLLMQADSRHPSTGRKKSPRKRSHSEHTRECAPDMSSSGSPDSSNTESSYTSVSNASEPPSDDGVPAPQKRRRILCPTSGGSGPSFELKESRSGAVFLEELPEDFEIAEQEQSTRGRKRTRT